MSCWLGSIACPSPAEGLTPAGNVAQTFGSAGLGLGLAGGSVLWAVGEMDG